MKGPAEGAGEPHTPNAKRFPMIVTDHKTVAVTPSRTAPVWIVPPEVEIPSEVKAARATLDMSNDCPCDCGNQRHVLPWQPFDDLPWRPFDDED